MDYKFYMQRCDKYGSPMSVPDGTPNKDLLENPIDLESYFVGLLYRSCQGLNTIGKAKNIYTETYSDADGTRVFVPDEITNETTKVILTIVFVGDDRFDVRDRFNDYIRHGFHKYWDTARKRSFVFYVDGELPIGEEKWYGSKPYLSCEYTLNNINGKTFPITQK